jgi:hypothetical protein
MEVRVEKAVVEFQKNPDAVSKKTEEAIKHMGVKSDPKLVERLAAQVLVAYRMESRKTAKDTAAGILYGAGVSEAKSTSPSTKKMQPELLQGRGHKAAGGRRRRRPAAITEKRGNKAAAAINSESGTERRGNKAAAAGTPERGSEMREADLGGRNGRLGSREQRGAQQRAKHVASSAGTSENRRPFTKIYT